MGEAGGALVFGRVGTPSSIAWYKKLVVAIPPLRSPGSLSSTSGRGDRACSRPPVFPEEPGMRGCSDFDVPQSRLDGQRASFSRWHRRTGGVP